MSRMKGFAATARRGITLTALAATLLPAVAVAQATERTSTRTTQETRETDRARREAQEKLLERLDSLRWEFEHERMSEQERAELRQELQRAFRALDESMAHMRELNMAREAARAARVWSTSPDVVMLWMRPSGYLGLSFDGPNTEDMRDGEHYIRFYQYPLIALVEPSSPAERAGIRKGDTLLALNGTDVVRNEIPLSKMLVPDTKVTVRVRRSGDAKNIAVVVGRAPEYVKRRFTPPAIAAAPVAPPALRVRTPDLPEPAVAPAPPVMSGFVWVSNDGIGGAKLETVTEGWARTLGVNGGVLVVRAVTGTPAYESGLRDGDVIVTASGKPVTTIRDLRNAVSWANEEDGVKLVIVRERKQKELTLRW